MKIYTILAFAFVATLLFAMPFTLAENETESVIAPTPGTTETITQTVDSETVTAINDDLNESVGPMRIGWENVKLWFTFNNEKKAIQELKIARLRLIQARIAARNNDTEAMQNAIEAHNRILERVQERINAIDGASDNRGAKLAVEKLVGLERAIEVHEARISKLNEILASENLTDEQRARIEDKLERAENNTAKLRELEADKKEKIKTRLRAVSNMTEEEANAAIQELEDAQNLSAVKKLVAEVKMKHIERMLEKFREKVAEAQAKGKNVSGLENVVQVMENIRDRIQERQEVRANKSQ